MNQFEKKKHDNQVFYDGRWVQKDNFRVFVYNAFGKKIANSYDEYLKMIESGEWFSSVELAEVKPEENVTPIKRGRKRKDGTDS